MRDDTRSSLSLTAAFLGVFTAATGCSRNPGEPRDPSCTRLEAGYGPAGTVPVRAETVVSGLDVPWSVAFLPNGDWLVTERAGAIRIVRAGRLLPAIARVPVAASGEGGLLGAVLHPQFAENSLFYIYFTADQDGLERNRLERWRLADDGSRAARERVILDNIPAETRHDGGRLRFGPDGKLYVGTGDAGDENLSQSKSSLAGKILRLEPDGSIPADNPFGNSFVFALGIRNTQGFDWLDERTLVVTDHGPSSPLFGRKGHDEVNVVTAGDNLGWPTIFGCETASGLTTPRLTWKQAVPPGGAAIYRGSAIPEWTGSLLIGTLESKHLHRVVLTDDRKKIAHHEVYFRGDPPAGYGRLRDVIMGPDGELYVTTSNCDGRGECPRERDRILRIRPR